MQSISETVEQSQAEATKALIANSDGNTEVNGMKI